MTVHNNEAVASFVMNAVSTEVGVSPNSKGTQDPSNLATNVDLNPIQKVATATETGGVVAPPTGITSQKIMAVTSTAPPGTRTGSPCTSSVAPYGSSNIATMPSVVSATAGAPSSSNRCCDTGRTIYTDPVSGQSLCSCQYDVLNYQRLASAGSLVAGPGGVPLGVYPDSMSAYLSGIGTDQPQFYANPAGLDLKENIVGGAAPWPYPSVYHPYDGAFAGYPFNSYGMDLNGARRKNATRETTSTLKAWLNEHKKNPYPTKGEKIMLAIITKMTLTQVSTWFANARRRLKKENKMTWEPRNRVDDDDANIDDDEEKHADDSDILDAKDSGLGSNHDKDRSGSLGEILGDRPGESNNSDWSGSRPGSPNGSPDPYDRTGATSAIGHTLFHPAALHHQFRPPPGSPTDLLAYHHHQQQLLQQHQHSQQSSLQSSTANTSASLSTKPRIWSLADMASKDGKEVSKESSYGSQILPTHPAFFSHPAQHPSPGKILSPLAARIPNYSPYVRADVYRGFYGPTATTPINGPSQEFLEHQRTFGANLSAQSGLGMNPLLWKAAVTGSGSHFSALSLTTNNYNQQPGNQSGTSPSASSSSSSMGCDVVQITTSGLHQTTEQPNDQISGNSTPSSASSNSGKITPSINVTSLGGKP